MTQFPAIALDVRTELQQPDGTWVNVSAYNDYGPVSISRGHPDESTTTSASTLAATYVNADGRFSPNNPSGPYYPWISQNVPCRVSIPAQSAYLRMENDLGSYAACPDAAPLRISGDIDIRIDYQPTDSTGHQLAFNSATGGTLTSWLLSANGDGTVTFEWSPNGISAIAATSTAPVPWGRAVLRVTLAIATGTVTFFTGPPGGAGGSTWTQLGAAIATGATTLNAGANGILVGTFHGAVLELEVRNGIAGTVVAHPVFSAQAAGTTSFADAQSNTWTLGGTAEISDRSYRGHFEVAGFPKSQDPTGKTVTVAVDAGGLLRRKGQGQNPVASALTRGYTRLTGVGGLVAYIPMEDGSAATSLGSGTGGPVASFSGSPMLASDSSFAASNPLPQVNGAIITIPVPSYSGGTANMLRILWSAAAGAVADGTIIARMHTNGTVAWADLVYKSSGGGALDVIAYSASGAQLASTGAISFGLDGGHWLVELGLTPGSGNIVYGANVIAAGSTVQSGFSGTPISGSIGTTTSVVVNPGGASGLMAATVGHAAIQSVYSSTQLQSFAAILAAWVAEPAGQRFSRLCGEEGIPFRGQGDLSDTMPMGAQTPQTITALLQEAVDADRGIWCEPRQVLGFGYVARSALYNQPAAVALDYAQDHLAPWASNPTRDDQTIKNDVRLTQSGDGTTARQYAAPGQPISGGRLSVLPPSQGGCGTYDGGSATVNLYNDSDLAQLASWLVLLGTVDEDRHPGIAIDLANTDLASQYWSVLGMDLGSRLTIANPPVWLQPDQVSQLAQQVTEDLWTDTLVVKVAGVPESPYEVAQEGMPTARADTDGSALAAPVTSGATTLQVTPTGPSGLAWDTSASGFDIGVTGERVTVSAVAATAALSIGIADGTFESGVSGWQAFNGSLVQSGAQHHSGSFSAQVTATTGVSSTFLRPIAADYVPVIPLVAYTCTLWVNAGQSGCTYGAVIDWYDATLTFISSSPGATSSPGAFTWTQYTASGTAPANAAFARYGPTQAITTIGNYYYCDDVTFTVPAQALTAVRSVNGVVKAQLIGASLSLWASPVAPL